MPDHREHLSPVIEDIQPRAIEPDFVPLLHRDSLEISPKPIADHGAIRLVMGHIHASDKVRGLACSAARRL
jgi:hypothetical protein